MLYTSIMSAMLEVRDLHKAFNSLTAVDGISFSIAGGETFGLLGPNGAGKTTTVNMIVGALKPDSGVVNIGENGDPTSAAVRQTIGNAPQSLSIYDDLTAEENLRFFARLYGLSGKRMRERVRWSLEFAGLTERRSSRAGTFSGGMKRRLNLACALVHDPTTLILDEPTVGVDPQSRNLIFESIETLKREGRTIIYTTHYMEAAERLCDRVAIVDHGKILDIDTVENLIEKHGGKSVIVMDLIALPENADRLPGSIEDNTLRIETDKPMEQFAELASTGLKFSRTVIERADLETVFLNLTGRRLRD